MTKKDKQIIYNACELLEKGYFTHSCTAIIRSGGTFWDKRILKARYAEFYHKTCYKSWFDDHVTLRKKLRNRKIRILLLLFFAHCEGDL